MVSDGTLSVGKHKGKLFSEVYLSEKKRYVQWTLKKDSEEEVTGGLKVFIDYCRARDRGSPNEPAEVNDNTAVIDSGAGNNFGGNNFRESYNSGGTNSMITNLNQNVSANTNGYNSSANHNNGLGSFQNGGSSSSTDSGRNLNNYPILPNVPSNAPNDMRQSQNSNTGTANNTIVKKIKKQSQFTKKGTNRASMSSNYQSQQSQGSQSVGHNTFNNNTVSQNNNNLNSMYGSQSSAPFQDARSSQNRMSVGSAVNDSNVNDENVEPASKRPKLEEQKRTNSVLPMSTNYTGGGGILTSTNLNSQGNTASSSSNLKVCENCNQSFTPRETFHRYCVRCFSSRMSNNSTSHVSNNSNAGSQNGQTAYPNMSENNLAAMNNNAGASSEKFYLHVPREVSDNTKAALKSKHGQRSSDFFSFDWDLKLWSVSGKIDVIDNIEILKSYVLVCKSCKDPVCVTTCDEYLADKEYFSTKNWHRNCRTLEDLRITGECTNCKTKRKEKEREIYKCVYYEICQNVRDDWRSDRLINFETGGEKPVCDKCWQRLKECLDSERRKEEEAKRLKREEEEKIRRVEEAKVREEERKKAEEEKKRLEQQQKLEQARKAKEEQARMERYIDVPRRVITSPRTTSENFCLHHDYRKNVPNPHDKEKVKAAAKVCYGVKTSRWGCEYPTTFINDLTDKNSEPVGMWAIKGGKHHNVLKMDEWIVRCRKLYCREPINVSTLIERGEYTKKMQFKPLSEVNKMFQCNSSGLCEVEKLK